MSSFEKKIIHFLDSSVEHKIIEKPTADDLIGFAKSGKYEQEGWFSLSKSIGGIGAFILCFGIILIIAAKWNAFTDLTKISSFIALLGGSHFAGLYLSSNNYKNTASCFHFLGAILVIAGIGLVAQIFHLSGDIKNTLLIWMAMIIPLGVLLNSRSIALLSIIIFTCWCNIQIGEYGHSSIEIALFDTSVAITMVLSGMLIKDLNAKMSSALRVMGMVLLMLWFYIWGFTHKFGMFPVSSKELFPLLVIIISIALNIGLLLVNYIKQREHYFLMVMSCAVFTMFFIFIAIKTGVNSGDSYSLSNFGRSKEIYFLPLMVSILSWITYFALAIWGVFHGALNHRRSILNISIIILGIGIFTIFIDFVGKMLTTGAMFISCGVLILVMGFVLEKWRKNLIQSAQGENNHG